jgi:large subunit ribosomal protein L25
MNDVDVKCLPADLPTFIEVDLKDLAAGTSIHVSQLVLPKGVEVVHHGEGDPVVVTITMKGGAQAEEPEAAPVVVAAAPAAPVRKAERVDKR